MEKQPFKLIRIKMNIFLRGQKLQLQSYQQYSPADNPIWKERNERKEMKIKLVRVNEINDASLKTSFLKIWPCLNTEERTEWRDILHRRILCHGGLSRTSQNVQQHP